ncbi:hypothetical protein K432DRAFT_409923 [Lepidopterella palustris CBS 459.81]|uniref:Uncharacterized protein n=1 Tax=Lepidopterella palustris CBS 459.81 TaxID=1314670 RepID=A0A8E2DZ31_9PEZI|nr:hypothetical protein K432DRAFT_409923 [Lepidopterella palustris CBS 459.81]
MFQQSNPKEPPDSKIRSLRIHFTPPFKPSNLSIPPSPFSPRAPITPITAPTKPRLRISSTPTVSPHPPPPPPLQWLWQCHQCHHTYALGVTRRCLEDGHYFCAGTTTVKTWRKTVNPRRVRRHRPCASEFDYQGWKRWGKWRRYEEEEHWDPEPVSIFEEDSSASSSSEDERLKEVKNCWNNCNYPSECRWGKQFGAHTPAKIDAPVISVCPPPPPPPPVTSLEGVLHIEKTGERCSVKSGKNDFWGALLASATRRKSVDSTSPLSLSPVQEEPEKEENEADIPIAEPSPAILPASSASAALASITSPAPVTLKDMITKKSKKGKSIVAGPKTPEPVLQIPDPAGVVDFNFGLVKGANAGEASGSTSSRDPTGPLQRLKGSDSEYFSQREDDAFGK